jgi:hypothetical protein
MAVYFPEGYTSVGLGRFLSLGLVRDGWVLCARRGSVFLRFPSTPNAYTALYQVTSADILARATEWATTSPSAANEIFKVTAGVDVYLGQTRFTKPNAVAVEGSRAAFQQGGDCDWLPRRSTDALRS